VPTWTLPWSTTDAYAGTGKAYIEISGTWVYGTNPSISEESPCQAAALVAWKEAIERRVLGAKGMRAVVVVSGTAYGDGGGASCAVVGCCLASAGPTVAIHIVNGSGFARRPVSKWRGCTCV
jgi:hypothetical protein